MEEGRGPAGRGGGGREGGKRDSGLAKTMDSSSEESYLWAGDDIF